MVVSVSDPFGFAQTIERARSRRPGHGVPAHRTSSSPRRSEGAATARRPTRSGPAAVTLDGDEFAALREYEIGDDLRKVHWPATARTGELFIRQDTSYREPHVVVVLDTRADCPRRRLVRGRGGGGRVAARATDARRSTGRGPDGRRRRPLPGRRRRGRARSVEHGRARRLVGGARSRRRLGAVPRSSSSPGTSPAATPTPCGGPCNRTGRCVLVTTAASGPATPPLGAVTHVAVRDRDVAGAWNRTMLGGTRGRART